MQSKISYGIFSIIQNTKAFTGISINLVLHIAAEIQLLPLSLVVRWGSSCWAVYFKSEKELSFSLSTSINVLRKIWKNDVL